MTARRSRLALALSVVTVMANRAASTPEAFAQLLKRDFEGWLALTEANTIHSNGAMS